MEKREREKKENRGKRKVDKDKSLENPNQTRESVSYPKEKKNSQ